MGRSLRILGMADLHNRAEQLSLLRDVDADLIAFCGDLHNAGTSDEARPVARALASLGPPVIIVPGNMDPMDFVSSLWEEVGLVMIHRRSHVFEDCGFIGMGGMVIRDARRLGDATRCYHLDDDVYQALTKAHKDIAGLDRRVVLTHQPPRGCLDTIYSGEATGSVGLRRFILEHEPDLLICGHIHEGRGEAALGRTKVVNVGELRSGYAALIELDDKVRVRWVGPGLGPEVREG